MAGIAGGIYNALIRRNPVFLTTVFVSAFTFEVAFDRGFDRIWDNLNKGRQWKDIKSKYIQTEPEADEE